MKRVEPRRHNDLVSRARRGDRVALAALLNAHSARLLDSVRAELGDRLRQRLESQDVMQQVYLDALTSIGQFADRGPDSFFAWLRRIALNRICDVDRRAFQTVKRGGEVRAADLGSDDTVVGLFDALGIVVSTPSAVADRVEHARILDRALDQLTPYQRQVITLRYLHQLNVAETAAKMDRTERAVRSPCVRALIRLRELLGDAI